MFSSEIREDGKNFTFRLYANANVVKFNFEEKEKATRISHQQFLVGQELLIKVAQKNANGNARNL